MRIVDAHVHLYPPEIVADPGAWARANSEPHWAEMCTRLRRDGTPVQTFPTVDELLREMERAGVEHAVLLGWYWNNAAPCERQNAFFAECVREHPTRLSAFATWHPQCGFDELRRARDAELCGLGELSPHSQNYRMDDPAFARVLDLCAEFRWPVNLHVTDPDSRPYPGRVETPLAEFLVLARQFPTVNFILAHWGGRLPTKDRSALELSNLYYDTAATPLLYRSEIWNQFLAEVPSSRVIFGSDFPLNLYPRIDKAPVMRRLIDEAISGGVGEAIFARNIDHLLTRPKS